MLPHVRASSVSRALAIVGDRWTLLILREAFFGVRRFEEWRRRLCIARSLLTDRLRRLVEAGVLERALYAEMPPRREYRLTAMGRALYPVALMFRSWERRWGRRRQQSPIVHLRCGLATEPRCVCASCGADVDPRDSIPAEGPGSGRERRPPRRLHRRSTVSSAAGRTGPFLDEVVDLFGDRWTNLVLYAVFFGIRRFDAMRRELAIASNILADRLRRLTAAKVLSRTDVDDDCRVEYVLTERGRDLFAVVVTLMRWGDDWLAGRSGPPLVLRHRRCGRRLVAKVVCDRCLREVRPFDVGHVT
jgi:DNA-binding HxlR family transcriptional regulator